MKWMATFLHIEVKLDQVNLLRMTRWMRGHYSPYTGFKIRALAVWGRARSLSVTEVVHIIESIRVSEEELFRFFETWRTEWGSNPRFTIFQTCNFNHCTRAPLRWSKWKSCKHKTLTQYSVSYASLTFNHVLANVLRWLGDVAARRSRRLMDGTKCYQSLQKTIHQY